jgi:hypothetical protein
MLVERRNLREPIPLRHASIGEGKLMPLVEPQEFKLDHGVIITCAQPIDSDTLAEILKDFIRKVDHWKNDPESEDERLPRTPFTKA